MEERRWEELHTDCLVNIFGRVGMESLLLDVPFVCKSWYKATLDPQCWKILHFPIVSTYELHPFEDEFKVLESRLIKECKLNDKADFTAFTKFVIKRSNKAAVLLKLPAICDTEEIFSFVATECPDLKTLVLPFTISIEDESLIPSLVSKLNLLQEMTLSGCHNLKDVFVQISTHCRDFVGLVVLKAMISKYDALAIATLLPNLKSLVLRSALMKKDKLVTILKGCKQLVLFDGSNCTGFNEDDEDIINLASHIPQFTVTGSKEDPLGLLSYPCFQDPNLLDTLLESFPDLDEDDISWN